MLKNCNL